MITKMETILVSEGADAGVFSTSDALFEALEKKTPDLYILDVMMPQMDGWMVMEKIRRIPGQDKTPIIFSTCLFAPGEEHALNKSEKYCKIVSKPITVDRLKVSIAELFSEEL